ncbi:reticulon-1-A-like isoform X4 [Acipenser ruthenus]|uniref:reticulon-1-A-like isoform X4 n=1 Tax=Acipenser ruthenus TaxID=7906 RepID=UPI00145A538F|nr:reticulon-1-A-like isoform X4 [Acipenser ruthenus]
MEDQNQISSTTPSADDLRKLTQDYMEESSDLLENNEAEARWGVEDILDLTGGAADALLRHQSPVNQPVTPISFSNPEPFAMPEETPTASTGKPTETEQQLFTMAEETPTACTGKPTETEQHQGEKKQTKAIATAVVEDKPEAPKPESSAKVSSSLVSSSAFSNETIFPSAPSEPLMQSFAVVDLLYWRDIKKTGAVFGASLFFLLSLTVCSIVSVFSYLTLALLSVSITFRIYKGILQAIQKSDEGHPFKAYLDSDVAVSEEVVHKYSDVALGHVNCALKELRHLFLVEDLVDSLKFAVLMWILTYVGALFNGLTLIILALISLFSIPVIYERHQAQIDHYLSLVNNQVKDIVAKIQAKVPGLKRKTE